MQRSWIANERSGGGQRPHPARQKFESVILLRHAARCETPLLAVDHQADAILARDHVFQRKPPGFAEPVRKRGRQVDGEGHAVLRQHGIGLRDDILAAAVEGQAGKSIGLRQRDRPPAHFVHRDQIEVPALQRTNRPVEKLRRDFTPPVRLKRAGIARTHALEPQNDAGAAGLPLLQPEVAAEIAELHPGSPQNSDIRRQRPAPNHTVALPPPRPDCITLC